ncbi:MAG: glycosyltransferase family 39 protein [Candidatus Omnitrophota bacterium]
MIFLKFILCLSNFLLFGFFLMKLAIYPRQQFAQLGFIEKAVLSFGLGTGFVGLGTLLLSFSHTLDLYVLLAYQVLVLAVCYVLYRIRHKTADDVIVLVPKKQKSAISLIVIFFSLLIAWEVFYIFSEAACLPFVAWDAWGNWGMKAKMIYFEKSFPYKLWTQLPWMRHPDHLEYPLLMPYLEVYTYLFLGKIYEPLAKLFCSQYYLGLLALFFVHLRKDFSDTFALGACFCLATVPTIVDVAYSGYMDIALVFFVSAGVLYVWRYMRAQNNVDLLVGSLFVGLGTWVKNEGLSFWIALFFSCVALCLFRSLKVDKKRLLCSIFFIPLVIYLPWAIFKHRFAIEIGCLNNSLENIIPSIGHRLMIMFNAGKMSCFNPGQWNIFWFVFILSVVKFLIKPKDKFLAFFLFILFFQLMFYAVVFIVWPVSNQTIDLYIFSAMERLPLQTLPLALFFMCQQAGKLFIVKREEHV